MKVHFLNHSGFIVETAEKVLVFDYYKDPQGKLTPYLNGHKDLLFFVSHSHHDHFNPEIVQFDKYIKYYIVHKDVPIYGMVNENKIHYMNVYESIIFDDIMVYMYGSTDEGGSFLVDTKKEKIFHAGDLNWWHWLGDTEENNQGAKEMFNDEMEMLKGIECDIAFFPVDARLEEAREWGVLGFLEQVKVKDMLVAMHYFGDVWEPSLYFNAKYGRIPLWVPQKDGESITI